MTTRRKVKPETPFDPYAVLGVPPTATDDEIRKAFRVKATPFHPDRNAGDRKAARKYRLFEKAYTLLNDARRRAHFDQTGNADAPNMTGEIATILGPLYLKAVADAEVEAMNGFLGWGGASAPTLNPLRRVTNAVEAMIQANREERTKFENELRAFKKAQGRVTIAGGGPNVLEGVVACQVRGIQKILETTKAKHDILIQALDYLKLCSYQPGEAVGDLVGTKRVSKPRVAELPRSPFT